MKYIRIPVLDTEVMPTDDGREEVYIFFSATEYFPVSVELAEFLNRFVVLEEEFEPAAAPPLPPVKTPAQIRAEKLQEVQQRLHAVPSHKAPTTVKDQYGQPQPVDDPMEEFLIKMGIDFHPPAPDARLQIMRVNEEAGKDGNNLGAEELQALIQTIRNKAMPDHVRSQAFDRLVRIPVMVLYRTIPLTTESERRQIVAARMQFLDVATDKIKTTPQDLAVYIAGDPRGLAVEDRDGEITVLPKRVGEMFNLQASEDTRELIARENPDGGGTQAVVKPAARLGDIEARVPRVQAEGVGLVKRK